MAIAQSEIVISRLSARTLPGWALLRAGIDRLWPAFAVLIPVLLVPNAVSLDSVPILAASIISMIAALTMAHWLNGTLGFKLSLPPALVGFPLITLMLLPVTAINKGAGMAVVALLVAEILRHNSKAAGQDIVPAALVVLLGSEMTSILLDLSRSPMVALISLLFGLAAGLTLEQNRLVESAKSDPHCRRNLRRTVVESLLGIVIVGLIASYLAYLSERPVQMAAGVTAWYSAPFLMLAVLRGWDLLTQERLMHRHQLIKADPLFLVTLAGWFLMILLTIGPASGWISG